MVDWQYHDNTLVPLANWPLDEYVGGEYEDISGNALPLTVESGTQRDADLVPGFAGTWLDGATVLVENTGDASLRLLGDWSIAFFIRPTAYPGAAVGAEMATHGVPNAETAESDNFAYQTKLTQTAARIAATWETTGQVDVDVTTVAALVSHVGGHVALVKRGLDFEVYLDTVLVATATASGQPVGGGSGKFRFGGGTTGAGLAAVVASLVVFGEAITPSELFGVVPPVPPDIAVDPVVIDNRGGRTVTGQLAIGIADGDFYAYIGPLGTTSDPQARPLRPGNGNIVTVVDGLVEVSAPVLAIGGPYILTLQRLSGTGDATITSEPMITVVAHNMDSKTSSLRQWFSVHRVGARKPLNVDYPQE